ncbi:pneumococcal serine-rich repeat protein-like [Saccostrea echinata]|uniref:pneumococcal serine-rich repeat protein-like n=1 Tax=Saccostrea echinata TaxID=191078 RepID=UPI002A80C326|nr:pneumococcal serine-rich repeat protein-like [Saccostrea echinata]
MAADVRARQDKYQTIAFTLPISCQICLGKVKQPVLCPNNHVFCSGCMDVWLQRNKQCPACRTPINPANPVKKIAGGVTQGFDDKDKMSNPELRKARFDLLFKEYEEEFERLTEEVQLLRTENEVLQQQIQKNTGTKQLGPKEDPRHPDTSGVLVLNKKLQDAQKLYDKVKSELSRVRQENSSLKDENINLNRENQKLRQEIGNRSPHRYGRYTVATLEAKIQTHEKEINQLNKALEKSDKLIEDLNAELDSYRSKPKTTDHSSQSKLSSLSSKHSLDDPTLRSSSSLSSKRSIDDSLSSPYSVDVDLPSKRQLFSDEGEYQSSHKDYVNGEFYSSSDVHDYKAYDKNGAGKNTKRVTFDLPRNETVSFDLEMPSPLKGNRNNSNGRPASPVKGVLKNGKKSSLSNGDESLSLSKPDSLDDSYLDSRRGKSTRLEDEDDFYLSKYSHSSKINKDDNYNYKYTTGKYDADTIPRNESFDLDYPIKSKKRDNYDQVLDDTEVIQSELDDLDISITPDFTDCMKLLNRAEKKVSLGTQPTPYSSSRNDEFLDDYRVKDTYRSDPIFSDKKSTDAVRPLSDNKYTSKYYTADDYVPRSSSSQSDIPSSRYSGSASTYSDIQRSTASESDIPSNRYSVNSTYGDIPRSSASQSDIPSNRYNVSSSAYSDIPTSSRESSALPISSSGYSAVTGSTISTYKPSAIDTLKTSDWDTKSTGYQSSVSDRYTIPGENDKYGIDQYSSSKGGLSQNDQFGVSSDLSTRYASASYPSSYNSMTQTSSRLKSSDDISTPTKSASLLPLSQSGFSRSPSVDNLFMSSKSSTQAGKFATAEDIPSSAYKSRLSLPGFSSSVDNVGKYRTSGDRQGMSSVPPTDVAGSSRFLASSLPPKPVRTRSQSDLGTSVTALKSASYQRAKGNAPTATDTVGSFTSDNTLTSQKPPSYPLSSSSYQTEVGLTSSTSNPPPFLENNKYTGSLVPRQDALDAVSTNKFTNSTSVVGERGPVKASYSYTDFDIGVNPRNKSNITELPLSNRLHTRSNSLDLPLNNKDSESFTTSQRFSSVADQYSSGVSYNIDNRPMHAFDKDMGHFDPIATTNYVSSSLPNSVSLTGGSTLDDPGKGRYISSSYMTSSQTSVTSSITFSSSHSSTTSSTSNLPPTSSYPSYQVSKSLDPIRESSAKGNSYLSNTSTTGDISRSESFLPEPKKRLFDSTDELDLSLSPIKTTRKTDRY